MWPILVAIGPIHIFSFSIFLIVAWAVFSFIFWKILRAQAVEEERIFDLTFYSTLAALVSARIGFVLEHREFFTDNLLKVAALWVQPGLSLFAALIGGFIVLVYVARLYKIRLGYVLDAFAVAYGAALIPGKIGSLLDGSEVGKATSVPWAVPYVGHIGGRHPVQLYEIAALLCILAALVFLQKRAAKHRWPYGLLGIWFFFLYATGEFALEFAKDSSVYWLSLTVNQYVLIALFGESVGAFYVRGGVREKIRPAAAAFKRSVARMRERIYAKFSKRSSP